MSLTSAMLIGRTALTASQVGIQVAGNNMANAATPGYSRQVAFLKAIPGDQSILGISAGRGVSVSDVRRQVDAALQARLWNGVSDESSAQQQLGLLSQIESTLGELSDRDLSSELQSFFNTWSERANLSKSSSVVVQQGVKLAQFIQRTRGDLANLRTQIDTQLGITVDKADQLLSSVAALNTQVAAAEATGAHANSLRDQRDQAISELAKYMDITAIEQANGTVDVLVGSTPVILGGVSRGLNFELVSDNGSVQARITAGDPPEDIAIESGQIGGLLATRGKSVDKVMTDLDTIAAELIFQVNKLHSTGANKPGLTNNTGTRVVSTPDRLLALNDPNNPSFADLPFAAKTGGFTVRITAPSGATETVRIDVDLDGLTAAGTPGFTNDTTPDQIRAQLDGLAGLQASWTPDGKLQLTADSGFTFDFADDTSGVLAVLGVNTYFTGTNSADIAVRADLQSDPTHLQVGRWTNGQFAENGTALKLAALQSEALGGLAGRTISAAWADTAQEVGVQTASAKVNAQALSDVRASLEAQRSAVSGVSLDEESINLLNFQRQYQSAARLIDVSNQLLTTLINLV